MRIWGIAVPVFILLLLIPLSIEYRLAHPNVPPGLQRSECLAPTIGGENWKDNFLRRGGRITPSTGAQWQGDAYSSPSIAQGRDLRKYDTLELRDRDHFHPSQRVHTPIMAQARTFLWQHWRTHRRGYLILTLSSVDHTGTAHIFIEPDDSGRWRVYWRQIDARELVDNPTVYWLIWVTQNESDKLTTPVPSGQVPDPLVNKLEFRDVCGEVDRVL